MKKFEHRYMRVDQSSDNYGQFLFDRLRRDDAAWALVSVIVLYSNELIMYFRREIE